MKLFLYALMMTTFMLVGCESYQRDDAVQEQEEQEAAAADEIKTVPEKGGNAGNR